MYIIFVPDSIIRGTRHKAQRYDPYNKVKERRRGILKMDPAVQKPKAVRKKKDAATPVAPTVATVAIPVTASVKEDDDKKRGRKPRGSKLIIREAVSDDSRPPAPNVILHLKCSLKDLEDHNAAVNKILKNPLDYNPNVPPDIMTFDVMSAQSYGIYEAAAPSDAVQESAAYTGLCKKCAAPCNEKEGAAAEEVTLDIGAKLKDLKITYYKGQVDLTKKACCFWCTYEFDTRPVYIPRQELVESVLVYGNFCSPECAVAFLFKENIDDHMKFERYQFMNKIYGATTQYKHSIRPAPNPMYILDRFMGTLSIQEYRQLIKTQTNSLIVIDKPMTRILPEIHADNDAVGSAYKIKKAVRVQ